MRENNSVLGNEKSKVLFSCQKRRSAKEPFKNILKTPGDKWFKNYFKNLFIYTDILKKCRIYQQFQKITFESGFIISCPI